MSQHGCSRPYSNQELREAEAEAEEEENKGLKQDDIFSSFFHGPAYVQGRKKVSIVSKKNISLDILTERNY